MKYTLLFSALLAYPWAQSTPLTLNEVAHVISRDTALAAEKYTTLTEMTQFKQNVSALSEKNPYFAYPRGKKVFYPFGGADVFFPSKFFPDSEKLVLVARENVKIIPTPDSRDTQTLESLKNSVNRAHNCQLLLFSFIRTNDVGVEINNGIGMATAIAGAMGALGYQLLNAVYYSEIFCLENGDCHPVAVLNPQQASRLIGVEIFYTKPGETKVRSISYYNQDLGNEPDTGAGHSRDPNFFSYLEQEDFDTTYYKAASYLSQKPYFSKINAVAKKSDFILQSDCGLAFREFAKSNEWTVNLYGNYTHRSPFFTYIETQKDLKDAYATTIKNRHHSWQNVYYGFDFNSAYDYSGAQRDVRKFNLMIAHRKY